MTHATARATLGPAVSAIRGRAGPLMMDPEGQHIEALVDRVMVGRAVARMQDQVEHDTTGPGGRCIVGQGAVRTMDQAGRPTPDPEDHVTQGRAGPVLLGPVEGLTVRQFAARPKPRSRRPIGRNAM